MKKFFKFENIPLLFVSISLSILVLSWFDFKLSNHNSLIKNNNIKNSGGKFIKPETDHAIKNAIKNGLLSKKEALFYHPEEKK